MSSLTLYCPRMAINRVNGQLKRTAIEPMVATLGGVQLLRPVNIPETYVREPHPWNPLYWLVDPCVGTGNGLTVSLPEEPSTWDFRLAKMIARSIVAAVIYEPDDLTMPTMHGTVTFPDCPIDDVLLQTCYAQVITAEGTIQ